MIWIYSKCVRIIEAKLTVFKEYEKYLSQKNILLHHNLSSQNCEKIAMLCGKQRLAHLANLLQMISESIPINELAKIMRNAAKETLTNETVRNICYSAIILYEGKSVGNVDESPYVCRSGFTVRRIKRLLMKKTIENLALSFGNYVCQAFQKSIKSLIETVNHKFSDLDIHLSGETFAKLERTIEGIFINIVRRIIDLMHEVYEISVTVVSTLVWSVDVNSREWRRNIADEIYSKVSEKKIEIIYGTLPLITEMCVNTKADLTKRLNLILSVEKNISLADQKKRKYEMFSSSFNNP